MASSENEVPDLSALKISEPTKSSKKKKPAPVVDSWEDDIPSSSEDESVPEPSKLPEPASESESESKSKPSKVKTVSSASSNIPDPYDYYASQATTPSVPEKRPEKSMAVVNRLIAGSLGIRVKRTEEQRQFEKNQIENEKKRRDEERRKKAEAEDQKRSIWDD